MILIDDHANVDLDQIAEQHYHNRIGTPNADGVNYHDTSSLVGRIRVQRALDATIPNQTRIEFWDYLLGNDFVNLKRVIISRPGELKVIIGEIEEICGVGFFSNNVNYDNATLTDFGKIVERVFNYSAYRNGEECSNTCNQLNLSYCPYCNEQVIQVIEDINGLTGDLERRALLQLDHFYPQSRHPYFAISFFNMIPVCSICNATLKGKKRFDIDSHFNPFDKRLDDYFGFLLDSIILSKIDDVNFSYVNKSPFPDTSLKDFRIIDRYKNFAHKRVVFKLVKTFKYHSPKINSSIAKQIADLFIATDSIKKILLDSNNVPTKRSEINQIQLGKLKQDILIQMGVLSAI